MTRLGRKINDHSSSRFPNLPAHHRHTAALAIVCLLLIIQSACSTASRQTNTPASVASQSAPDDSTTEPASSSTNFVEFENTKFVFDPQASDTDRQLAQRSISDANNYFEEHGYAVGPATITLTFNESKEFSTGRPDPNGALVIAGSDWDSFGDMDRYKMFAHEYYHVLQMHLSDSKSTSESMAVWLKEGSAEYLARWLAEANGFSNFQEFKRQSSATARTAPVKLSDLEDQMSYDHYNQLYGGLSAIAIDYLFTQFSEDALFSYWENLGKSRDWRAAFQSTFGLTPDAFYKEYEAYVKSL